ncbi:MAG: ABC transporter ATP-binding protein [Balneolaceae bacterium]
MSHNIVLEAFNISKTFPSKSGKGTLEVLTDVSLAVSRSEITAIIGSSGSGKSTLLHILGGLDQPASGNVQWNRSSINDWTMDKLAEERNRQVGFIFQFHHLLPEFTALENVYMPALIAGTPMKEAEYRAALLLERMGMAERTEHRPSQLSGGEQQRVAIARAMMNSPSIILADEPTGNLDEKNTESILGQLAELRETEQVAMVLITHEKEIASRCDTVYELRQGILHPFKETR